MRGFDSRRSQFFFLHVLIDVAFVYIATSDEYIAYSYVTQSKMRDPSAAVTREFVRRSIGVEAVQSCGQQR